MFNGFWWFLTKSIILYNKPRQGISFLSFFFHFCNWRIQKKDEKKSRLHVKLSWNIFVIRKKKKERKKVKTNLSWQFHSTLTFCCPAIAESQGWDAFISYITMYKDKCRICVMSLKQERTNLAFPSESKPLRLLKPRKFQVIRVMM